MYSWLCFWIGQKEGWITSDSDSEITVGWFSFLFIPMEYDIQSLIAVYDEIAKYA